MRDVNERINDLYVQFHAAPITQKPYLKIELDKLQKEEAEEMDRRFKASLKLPIDGGAQILKHIDELLRKYEVPKSE